MGCRPDLTRFHRAPSKKSSIQEDKEEFRSHVFLLVVCRWRKGLERQIGKQSWFFFFWAEAHFQIVLGGGNQERNLSEFQCCALELCQFSSCLPIIWYRIFTKIACNIEAEVCFYICFPDSLSKVTYYLQVIQFWMQTLQHF